MQGLNQNCVFLITGGAGGIGRATATALGQAGSRVIITDVDAEAGEAAAAEIQAQTGAKVRFVPLDVTDEAQVAKVVEQLEQEGWPVYGVMANAGIAPTSAAIDYPAALWRQTVDINLNGVFWTAQAFGQRMLARGEGVVLITASIAAFRVVSPETHAAYGATKAAVAHLAELLGVEWATHGVRVNAIAPGYTATPIIFRFS